MGCEEAKEPGALGEAGKQRPIVACQPAIEGPVAHAFEGMQEPQGDHLTGPEVRLGVFGDGAYLLIDFIEQRGDKLYGAHSGSPPMGGMSRLPAWKSRRTTASPKAYLISFYRSIYIEWFVRD